MFKTDDLLLQLPEAGHMLFTDSPDAAAVGERDIEWQKYATGFCDAADHLVAQAIGRGSMRDWLVFPVLALYRQSIELHLKTAIRDCLTCDGPRLAWEKTPQDAKTLARTHDLNWLWASLLKLASALDNRVEMDSALLNSGRLISEMNAVDPDAARFRYPTTKDDKPGLELRRVDLDNVMVRVGAIIGVIEGVAECALQERAFQSEMKEEFRP